MDDKVDSSGREYEDFNNAWKNMASNLDIMKRKYEDLYDKKKESSELNRVCTFLLPSM